MYMREILRVLRRDDGWAQMIELGYPYVHSDNNSVGHSGCGKFTAVALVERFYDPTVGSILVDWISISEYNLSELRKYLGLVNQESTIIAKLTLACALELSDSIFSLVQPST